MNDRNGAKNNDDDDVEEELGRALGFATSKASAGQSEQQRQQQHVQKQRFLPVRPSHRFHQDFLETYNRGDGSGSTLIRTKPLPLRPKSMLLDAARHQSKKRDDPSSSLNEPELAGAKRAKSGAAPLAPMTVAVPTSYQQHEDDHKTTATTYTDVQELEQEAQLLTVTMVNSDLDAVQQMEQRMTEITSLLSQFANLVTLQQDEVAVIHQDTAAAKANMEQGQDELVNAKEAVRASQHYMAKAITAMAVMLLIFHWMKA